MRTILTVLSLFMLMALTGCQSLTLTRTQTKLEHFLYGMPTNPCDEAVYVRDQTVCVILLNSYTNEHKNLSAKEKGYIAKKMCKDEIDGTFFVATGDRGTEFFICNKDIETAEREFEWKLKIYFRTQI